jgi:hypothetical protein
MEGGHVGPRRIGGFHAGAGRCQVPGVGYWVPGGRRSECPKNWSLTPDTWNLTPVLPLPLGFVSVGGVFPRFLASVEDAVDYRHIGE